MSKYTRRFKKNKKNKTIKRGGGDSNENMKENSNENMKENSNENIKKRQGIFDMIGNKISGAASSAAKTIGDAGLKIMGLQRIDKNQEEENNKEEDKTTKINESIGKIGDAASGVVSSVENVMDKTGATIFNATNSVIGSDDVKDTTKAAAEETSNIIKEGAEAFNEALNKPEVKAEIKEALDNAGEVGSMVVEASKKPFNKMVDVAAQAAPTIVGETAAGLTKVGFDMLGAVPYLGGIIDLGKAVNDGSKAISASVEAASEVVEASSDAVTETTKNIEKGIKELNEKKEESQEISDRTTNSINDFENPSTKKEDTLGGGIRKTRRRLSKRKAKSKRVRFAI
jgi:hypothetical protein